MAQLFEILQRKTVFSKFIFDIEEIELRYEQFDGSMAEPVKRLVLNRGDAAAVLMHDPSSDTVLLCEQFRAPTISNGTGWLLELPAGMMDDGETAEACARREALEETGQEPEKLSKIATVYPSPGGSSERVHILYARVTMRQDLPNTAGIEEEGEDIRTAVLPFEEVLTQLEAGAIKDAKTVIALQWLALQSRNGGH